MSDMEAMKVVLKPLSIAESKVHLEALCKFDEDGYDRYEYCQEHGIREVDGNVYKTKEIELDPYGFTDATYNQDGTITVVGLWYNGGASLEEIIEEALKND